MADEAIISPANPTVVADPPPSAPGKGFDDPAFVDGLQKALDSDAGKPPAQPATQPTSKPSATPKSSKLSEGISKLTGKEKPSGMQREDAEPGKGVTTDRDSAVPEYKPGTKAEEWKAVHKARDEAIARAVAAEERLSKTRNEATQSVQKQLDEIRSENERLLAEIERTNIERSPRFNKEFEQRTGSVLSKLRTTVGPSELSKVEQLIRAPASEARTSALEEIMGNLSPLKQRQFADIVSTYDGLVDERSYRIQQALENAQTDGATRQAETERQRQAHLQAFDAESARWKEALANSDNQEFNQAVEQGLENAKKFFTQDLSADEMTRVTHWAGVGPVFAEMVNTLSAELESAKAELAKFQNGHPDPGATAGERSESEPSISDQIKRAGSLGEAIAEDMRRKGVVRGDYL